MCWGEGARRCPGYAEARVQSRKRLREAAQRAQPEEAQPRSARVGSGWAMEPLPEPASGPRLRPHRLLLLSLLLLLLLLLPAPELGPRQARAEDTDGVRLPSKCEGEGAGPVGSILLGAGLAERVGGGTVPGSERVSFPGTYSVPGTVLDAGNAGAAERSGLGAPGAQKSLKTSSYNGGGRCHERGGAGLWGLGEEHLNLDPKCGERLPPGSPE